MEIFIDESGSFVTNGAQINSWCGVAAFTCSNKSKYREQLAKLKRKENRNKKLEIKIHELSEVNYLSFLEDLYQAGGLLICLATDSGFNEKALVEKHKNKQVQLLLDNIQKMKYQTGKEGVKYLASQIQKLPNQLYIQLFCQIYLMHSFINRAIPYIVQRKPQSLKKFVWRIDQKSPDIKTDFEDAFEKLCPALLQTLSLTEPGVGLKWCDYSHMKEYIYEKGTLPEYLVEEFPQLNDESGFNIQKIIRDDIGFVDSASCDGVQIADLLASGLRKVLRQEFTDNDLVASALGKLMIQERKNRPVLKLITFGEEKVINDNDLKSLINLITRSCRPMVLKTNLR